MALRDVSLATRGSGEVAVLEGQLLAEVAVLLDRLGHRPAAVDAEAVTTALHSWAFTEDLDERLDADDLAADQIDLAVLHYLCYRAGAWPMFGG